MKSAQGAKFHRARRSIFVRLWRFRLRKSRVGRCAMAQRRTDTPPVKRDSMTIQSA